MIKYERGRHKCPRRGCKVSVSNRLYACPADWQALSEHAQRAIRDTNGLHVLDARRRAAFHVASAEWESLQT